MMRDVWGHIEILRSQYDLKHFSSLFQNQIIYCYFMLAIDSLTLNFLKKLSKKMICLNSFLTSVKGKLAGGETWRERKSQRWEMGVHLASYILWLTLCLFQDRLGHNATRRRMMDCMCVCKRERSLSWWH